MTDLEDRTTGDRPAPPEPNPPGTRPAQTPLAGALGAGFLFALVALAAMAGGWPLLATIGALALMITLHELGHYITAKRAGMKVTEFFIGFGPRIWSFHRGETEYGVKAIWIGAYVKIVGMHNLDEFAPEDEPRAYMHKPFWRRLSVAVAGSTMHFLLAFVVLVVAFGAVGLPAGVAGVSQRDADAIDTAESHATWTVGLVEDGTPAASIVQVGDRIVSVGDQSVSTYDEFTAAVVAQHPGEPVDIVYEHDGVTSTAEVRLAPRDDNPDQGFFGIGPHFDLATTRVGFPTAVRNAGTTFVASVGQTFDGLRTIFSPSGLASIGRQAFTSDDRGPAVEGSGGGSHSNSGSSQEVKPSGLVGISAIGTDLLHDGQWGVWLVFFAVINVFIGIFNLVPLLPLDGGHVAIAVYEKIRTMLRKGVPYHVDVLKLLPVTYAVVMLLAFVGLSSFVLDVRTQVGE